jgi:hypothetical protein
MLFLPNRVFYVKSCSSCQIMQFMSNHAVHVKSCSSCQIMSFMSIYAIHVKSCHSCQVMSFMSWFIWLYLKISKDGRVGGSKGGREGRGVKYIFLGLRRQLRCLAEGKNGLVSIFTNVNHNSHAVLHTISIASYASYAMFTIDSLCRVSIHRDARCVCRQFRNVYRIERVLRLRPICFMHLELYSIPCV